MVKAYLRLPSQCGVAAGAKDWSKSFALGCCTVATVLCLNYNAVCVLQLSAASLGGGHFLTTIIMTKQEQGAESVSTIVCHSPAHILAAPVKS